MHHAGSDKRSSKPLKGGILNFRMVKVSVKSDFFEEVKLRSFFQLPHGQKKKRVFGPLFSRQGLCSRVGGPRIRR